MPASMFREDINIVGVPLTAITNATYDASTGTLVVTGTGFASERTFANSGASGSGPMRFRRSGPT